MSVSSWSISIISTDYDLHDIRNELTSELTKNGFQPIAFERNDFPVEPGLHSHDACIQALIRADIVVLIIDKRDGGLYIGSDELSITRTEYLSAIEKKKILIPCVRDKAWQDRFAYTQQEDKTNYKPAYVENINVINFINEVHKSSIDNFIHFFKTSSDLKSGIINRLEGLSRYVLGKITQAQISMVMSTKTSTGMRFSLGDVLKRGYFVEPPYELLSGENHSNKTISEVLKCLKSYGQTVLLLGKAGSGKSTVLAKAFIEHASCCISERSSILPFFISLRSRGNEYQFNIVDYLNEEIAIWLKKTPYPLLNLNSIKPIFYIDGLDELTEDVSKTDFNKIYQSEMFSCPFILSCRELFAKNHLDTNINFMSLFNKIIKLDIWNKDIYEKYITAFCKIHDNETLSIQIIKHLDSSPTIKEIVSNPLLITLFLWVIEEGALTIPLDIKSQHALFEKCLEYWIKKELSRLHLVGTQKGRDLETLVRQSIEIAAWEIYKSRFESESGLSVNKFYSRLIEKMPEANQIVQKEIFENLLDINTIQGEIKGMLHEFFLENLVACTIHQGFCESRYPFPNCLELIIRPEINQIIRSIWHTTEDKALSLIIDNLQNVYMNNIDDDPPLKIIIRNQACYYIGRINSDKSSQILKKLNAIENALTVKLSIAFGLIKKGDLATEDFLLTQLKNDENWDRSNRGYHLIYYYDWIANETIPPFPPYLDPENIPWKNTFLNLLRHIESFLPKHIMLRRIELFTIRRFIETRKEPSPLDKAYLDRIESSILSKHINHHSFPDYNDKVIFEFNELKKKINLTIEATE